MSEPSFAIAEDSSLLGIAAELRSGQPIPNLFFAAVQYLLESEGGHPLRAFYGTFTERPRNPVEASPAFKDFAEGRREEIVDLLKSRWSRRMK